LPSARSYELKRVSPEAFEEGPKYGDLWAELANNDGQDHVNSRVGEALTVGEARTLHLPASRGERARDQKSLEDWQRDLHRDLHRSIPAVAPTNAPTRFPTKAPTKAPTKSPRKAPTCPKAMKGVNGKGCKMMKI
jgi:hypothetical protein